MPRRDPPLGQPRPADGVKVVAGILGTATAISDAIGAGFTDGGRRVAAPVCQQ
jgi:hypothetical protein